MKLVSPSDLQQNTTVGLSSSPKYWILFLWIFIKCQCLENVQSTLLDIVCIISRKKHSFVWALLMTTRSLYKSLVYTAFL